MKRLILTMIIIMASIAASAQMYNGTSGFCHVPTGDINTEGDARIGSHIINKSMMPDTGFLYEGHKYHSLDYYMSVTPLKWMEMSYTCTERKTHGDGDIGGYGRKDRYLSMKAQLLKEKESRPSVAIGMNDLGTTIKEARDRSDVQYYFRNCYIAASKHFQFGNNLLEASIAYRYFTRGYNHKWNGIVGGVSYTTMLLPQARAIVEYTGNELIVGADVLILQHLKLQASLKDFKYPSFGLCYQTNLLGKYNMHSK